MKQLPFYGLRRRRHNRELADKSTHLVQCSYFLARMLYKDVLTLRLYISYFYNTTRHLFRIFVFVLLSLYIHVLLALCIAKVFIKLLLWP